jgi:sugar phosphate isomerase/epimerase
MAQPKIGLSMLYTLGKPFGNMLLELRKSPTRIIEIVDDGFHVLNKRRVDLLIEAANSYSLEFSVHAPFADINIASSSKIILKACMKRLKQSMQHAHDLGAYLWVFHPGNKSGISEFYPGLDWKQNSMSILELHRIAEELGLQIAMENLPEKYNFLMKNPGDFLRFHRETGLDDIGIVLDTGHANLEDQLQPFIQNLSSRIVHIHVSDNHGKVDEHLGLGHGNIDWEIFAKNLKSSKFKGTVVTESVFNVQETVTSLEKLLS